MNEVWDTPKKEHVIVSERTQIAPNGLIRKIKSGTGFVLLVTMIENFWGKNNTNLLRNCFFFQSMRMIKRKLRTKQMQTLSKLWLHWKNGQLFVALFYQNRKKRKRHWKGQRVSEEAGWFVLSGLRGTEFYLSNMEQFIDLTFSNVVRVSRCWRIEVYTY